MNDQPLVSVLMPLYNGAQYLRASIDSILRQTYQNLELIILNDGSTDDSEKIVQSYSDGRIRYECNEKNLGIVATRNKLLQLAKGEYFAIHDCDDTIAPQKLEKQIAYLETHPSCGVCGTWAKKIDEKGAIVGKIQLLKNNEDIKMNLLFQSSFVHSSVVFRRTEDMPIHYDANFPVSMDFDLWERLKEQTDFYNIPEFLVDYRWHEDNISNQKKGLQEAKRDEIIRRELTEIGEFSEDDVQNYIAIGSLIERKAEEYEAMGRSLRNLANANNESKKFIQHKLIAFLWYRWIFYCVYTKRYDKILRLKLPLRNVKIFFHLSVLLGQRAKGIFL